MISFQAAIELPRLLPQMHLHEKCMLLGSCFTEHIGNHLQQSGMQILQNPHGILFDPISVQQALLHYLHPPQITENQLFQHQELWRHWAFHSRYAHPQKELALEQMNAQIQAGHTFLKEAQWLMITLGSSYSYRLAETQMPVANCHKMPAALFEKHLCTIDETITALDGVLYQLFRFNPQVQIVFTISPVRHLRDGLVANNRSKARLLEAVHHLCQKFGRLHYFAAYELVVDVLRDYRFYDTDLAHPNYAATRFVIDHFMESGFSLADRQTAQQVNRLYTAARHRSDHPETRIHQQFLANQLAEAERLQQMHPFLQLDALKTLFRQQQTAQL